MTQDSIVESISYLIAQVGRRHRNKAGELLAQVDLYVGQEMFLLHLWEQDGRTQTEIVNDLCIQPATLTRMLDRMERAGLVVRQQDTDDARVSRVFLTDKGRNLQAPVQEVWQALEQQTLANFTLEERLLFRRLLLQVYENLNS